MSFFKCLSPMQLAAGISFSLAKLCGLSSVLALVVAHTNPIPAVVFGVLWGVGLILTFVFCGIAHAQGKEARQRELYERLKNRFEPVEKTYGKVKL